MTESSRSNMHLRRLQIYLDDHLAMLVGELELLDRCHRSNQHSELGQFLMRLKNDLSRQKSAVTQVRTQLGHESSFQSQLKQGAAWFAEKVGRFKLNDSLLEYSDLSRLVELETLTAAAQERIGMWDSLDNLPELGLRCEGTTFFSLREQSETHLDALRSFCRSASRQAFAGDPA